MALKVPHICNNIIRSSFELLALSPESGWCEDKKGGGEKEEETLADEEGAGDC